MRHAPVASNGDLYDTRATDWASLPPLRVGYERHARNVAVAADVKATLRAGGFAWPGGYPLYFVASDGEAMSFDSVRAELCNVLRAVRERSRDGWRVVGVDVNYEERLYCAHSGEPIPSAYEEE